MGDDLNRREFGRGLAGAVPLMAVLAVGSTATVAQEEKPETPPEPPKTLSDVDHLLEVVQRLYPDERLTAEMLDEIREDLARQLARSKVLSAFPLTNADEPAPIFAAWGGGS